MRYLWNRAACLLSLLLLRSSAKEEPQCNLAVIGAGIGGATAAYYARQEIGCHITVFEGSERVGGRASAITLEGGQHDIAEVGASIIYTGNQHLYNLTEKMGLQRLDPPGGDEGTALWDGERVRFMLEGGLLGTAKVLLRYGWSMVSLTRMVKAALVKFNGIYDLQREGKAFTTPEELWGAVGLQELTTMNITEHLSTRLGPGARVVNEIVYGVNRINYNQGLEMNALAGVVSLCPMVTGTLFRVEGGNARLAQELLLASKADLKTNTLVARVERHEDSSTYELFTQRGSSLGSYDAVVVAAPINQAGITFGGELTGVKLPTREYQVTHTTVVVGTVRASFWGYSASRARALPSGMLMTLEGGLREPVLSSLALLREPVDGRQATHKLFSREELGATHLARVFEDGYKVVFQKPWHAYPKLPTLLPGETFAPMQPWQHERVYYASALEGTVSAMEISAIAAKNVVLLLKQDLAAAAAATSSACAAREEKEVAAAA